MNMRLQAQAIQQADVPINAIRETALVQTFRAAIGYDHLTLIMISPFPFLIIGKVVRMESDFLFIRVETTHIAELEGRIMRVHIDEIIVFFIENDVNRIPRIREVPNRANRGGHH